VGEHDVVRPALEEAGVLLDFWKVAIKPGKPLVLGRRDETVVLGLPGNPVSAQVTFALFGLPLLRAMQGARRVVPQSRPMRLAGTIHQKPGRRAFYRGSMDRDRVVPLDGQASGSVNSMAWADALIVVPEDATLLEVDTTVEVLPLAEL
jgi:molybdopterin molybdotransferase